MVVNKTPERNGHLQQVSQRCTFTCDVKWFRDEGRTKIETLGKPELELRTRKLEMELELGPWGTKEYIVLLEGMKQYCMAVLKKTGMASGRIESGWRSTMCFSRPQGNQASCVQGSAIPLKMMKRITTCILQRGIGSSGAWEQYCWSDRYMGDGQRKKTKRTKEKCLSPEVYNQSTRIPFL